MLTNILRFDLCEELIVNSQEIVLFLDIYKRHQTMSCDVIQSVTMTEKRKKGFRDGLTQNNKRQLALLICLLLVSQMAQQASLC